MCVNIAPLLFFGMATSREEMLGVFILEFRTPIAVGYVFLKSSSLSICCQQDLCDFHLSARAIQAEGMGPAHQRERENLKEGGVKKNKCACVC